MKHTNVECILHADVNGVIVSIDHLIGVENNADPAG